MSLDDIAPRLAKARDQALEVMKEKDQRERALTKERQRLKDLVTHRELQVIRAMARQSSSRKDKQERQAKLDEAERALRKVNAELRRLKRMK